ncbi:hypothetical protein TcasGA2_TC003591 [Tribolium castaneum]|uniref:Uncharacterized protein n=1 Tax=Tribolium castaneum TaxID=7070 RepID=D6WHY2_TRICA|nr:hypothetical protein TcasGA2_TC003591 [Tribolium castaneum]
MDILEKLNVKTALCASALFRNCINYTDCWRGPDLTENCLKNQRSKNPAINLPMFGTQRSHGFFPIFAQKISIIALSAQIKKKPNKLLAIIRAFAQVLKRDSDHTCKSGGIKSGERREKFTTTRVDSKIRPSSTHLHLTKNAEELRSVCNREVWTSWRRRYPYYLVKGGSKTSLFEFLWGCQGAFGTPYPKINIPTPAAVIFSGNFRFSGAKAYFSRRLKVSVNERQDVQTA